MPIQKPSFLLLMLLISFGSITAVTYTPGLPALSAFFQVDSTTANLTMTVFLIGYAVGQLLYGPLSHRFGYKNALYIGISLEIVSSLLCALSSQLHSFWLLVLARLGMALGASVGLKMTFTLVAASYSQERARSIISHLMIAFAITPALGVAVGGVLVNAFSWVSTFYLMALYGCLILWLVIRMPEASITKDPQALQLKKIFQHYALTLKTLQLPLAASLMGIGTSFVYVFASLSPFIAMQVMGLTPSEYGFWSLIPPIGLVLGSQCSAKLNKTLSSFQAIFLGLGIMVPGVLAMLFGFLHGKITPAYLFVPLVIIYLGFGFVFSNAASIATRALEDKSNASAMMSFFNMALPTLSVLLVGLCHTHLVYLLSGYYCVLALIAIGLAVLLFKIKIR